MLVASSGELQVSARRPAIYERRCATLAGAGLLSVPAPEQDRGLDSAAAATDGLVARPVRQMARIRVARDLHPWRERVSVRV